MQQLHYAADVRRASEVEVPKPEVKPAELKLAQQLIEQQTADRFDPDAYKDEVRARIEAEIEKKVAGQEISVAETPPPGVSSACSSISPWGRAESGSASFALRMSRSATAVWRSGVGRSSGSTTAA